MFHLNHLVDLPTGWTFDTATAINNAGQITGFAIDPDGTTQAILITPTLPLAYSATPVPEPASALFLNRALLTRRRP